MDKPWTEMTPAEKRHVRFKKWLAPPGIKFLNRKAEAKYKEKVTRFIDAIELKKTPDRVPVILPLGFFPIYNAGIYLRTVMYDYPEIRRACKKIIRDFDMDILDVAYLGWPAKVYDMLGYKLYKWPGHGLAPEATSYQFVEGEYIKSDEYEALMHNPIDFGQRVFMPRIMEALKPFQSLPAYTPYSGLPMGYLMSFTRPEIRKLYRTLLDAGQELSKLTNVTQSCRSSAIKAGFPILRSGFATAPFDLLGDTLRGTQGIIMDMYRRPEKIFEAMEVILPQTVASAVAMADRSECPIVSIPLHKGQDGFMSREQYEKFYWPTLQKVIEGLINEGVVPLVFAEGRYGSRLDIIRDVPAGSMIWWFEQTDMADAKKALGGIACIAGNVPGSVLATGSPQNVKDYCRKTIEMAGEGGGLILNGTPFTQPGNPENLQAMLDAAKEYGVYRN